MAENEKETKPEKNNSKEPDELNPKDRVRKDKKNKEPVIIPFILPGSEEKSLYDPELKSKNIEQKERMNGSKTKKNGLEPRNGTAPKKRGGCP